MKQQVPPNRWKSFFLGGLSALLAIALLAAWQFPVLYRLPFLFSGDFSEKQTALFFSKVLSKKQVLKNQQSLSEAKKRVLDILGKQTAQPFFLFLSEEDNANLWGLPKGKTATSHFLPNLTFIVISPNGNTTDVIAHELMHAELHEQLGWWLHRTEISIWFDEGFALLADYRFHDQETNWQVITQGGKKAPSLQQLSDEATFHEIGNMSPLLNYYTSFRIVRQWWAETQPEGWENFKKHLKGGTAFEAAFHASFKQGTGKK